MKKDRGFNNIEIKIFILKNVQIASNLACNTDKLIVDLGFKDKRILLVSDEKIIKNSSKFFAKNLEKIIEKSLILKDPKADEKNLKIVEKSAKGFDLIIALGSGTIGDLCKLTSAKNNIPYVIFASAPSMNGYLSKNASILIKGHKKTLPATLPLAVFCDLGILKSAPEDLIKAGIGDSLCFYSCWFDWYLSHILLGTYFDETLFKSLEKKMNFLVKNYSKYSLRDEKLLKLLIEILLISGGLMTKAGGSYPASQSEHLIAHILEMKYEKKMHKILHGKQIAVTTLTSAFLQKKLLKTYAKKPPEFIFENNFEKKLAKYFDKKIALQCAAEFNQKNILMKQAKSFSNVVWQKYHKKLANILFDEVKLKKILQHFKINDSYRSFGIGKKEYEEAVKLSKFIRNRFTCLDLFY
ncbi:MAG: iron-containing alcohol dehydrogenase [Rickettsiales bacterium]|nr:iron-containing alcohol dehydrogenase [Rickettsiales bacterium]